MFVLFLGIFAAASAAPQHYHHYHNFHHPPPPPHGHFGLMEHHPHDGFMDPFLSDHIFDTRKFWEDLSKELKQLEDVLEEFGKRFPSGEFTAGEDGNMYKLTIFLEGYKESEIKVKAKDGVLMIQATHNTDDGSNQRTYLDLRTLPDNVNPEGNWNYDGAVLKISFPLKTSVEPKKAETTTETAIYTTVFPQEHSREQMESQENTGDSNMDVDVGLHNRGDNNELLTNEISGKHTVEATTYAVDLKNEVEFVPVRY